MKSKIIIFNILPLTLFALILAVSALVLYKVKKNPSNQNLIDHNINVPFVRTRTYFKAFLSTINTNISSINYSIEF